MDAATSLVEYYLQSNGFFTLTEAPVLGVERHALRALTDLDVIAVRLPGARGQVVEQRRTRSVGEPDSLMALQDGRVEMIIGEIKEGGATLNPALLRPEVLRVALLRLTALDDAAIERITQDLRTRGVSEADPRFRVRVIAFGSYRGEDLPRHITCVTLGQMLDFIDRRVGDWSALAPVQIKQPLISMLLMLYKARAGPQRARRRAKRAPAGGGGGGAGGGGGGGAGGLKAGRRR